MEKTLGTPSYNAPTEGKPDRHEHLIHLDTVREQKLIQVAKAHGMSAHDLVVKALDDFFNACIK